MAADKCALALGKLDGLLVGLTEAQERLFCAGLLRATLLAALTQAGFLDAPLRFDAWFAGLDRGPEETAQTPCSPYGLVRALLAHLSDHPWPPLAETARTIQTCGRFVADARAPGFDAAREAARTTDALAAAAALVERACESDEGPLPFEALARLTALAGADVLFAPAERALRTLVVDGRHVALDAAPAHTPLWALDVALGALLARSGCWHRALPCPGVVTAALLVPGMAPAERALHAAQALAAAAQRLIGLVETARRQAALLAGRLGHLRRQARAPRLWILLAGFAPLGLDQLAAAGGVSRRGTYAVGAALTEAGLARRSRVKGKVLLIAEEHAGAGRGVSEDATPTTLPGRALAEFEAAMADIDRLLSRHGEQG